MALPSADLITAIRAGEAARCYFFEMTHSQGTVRAWDGIGDIWFNSATYAGIYGLARIEGLSDSGEIEDHTVTLTLNGVPASALQDTDPNIRGEAATLTAAWMKPDGTLFGDQLIVYKGKGDFLTSMIDEETATIKITLRSEMANWNSPPGAFYTDKDQDRLFAGDTGFSLVKSLQDKTLTGWART